MDRDRYRPPLDPRSWRGRGPRTRPDPLENGIGLGRKHPLLGLLAVWVAGVAVIVGLSFVLARRPEGFVAVLIMLGLLTTVRI